MAKGKVQKDEDLSLDFGVGKLSLGGLFKGVEKLVDLAEKLKDAGGEIKKEGEIDLSHIKEGMKGVFGFSIKTAAGGKEVKLEPFGNVKKTPEGPKIEEEREPITDIFDEKEEIRVYAEMPGVNEGDIKVDFPPQAPACHPSGRGSPSAKKVDIIEISARTGERKYHKEVLLPAEVNTGTLTFSYKNGILEIRIKK